MLCEKKEFSPNYTYIMYICKIKGGSYFIGSLHNTICFKVACLTEQIIHPLFYFFPNSL